MKRNKSELHGLISLCQKQSLVSKYLQTNLVDVIKVAEFTCLNSESTFSIFHCRKNYLLYFKPGEKWLFPNEAIFSENYYIAETLEEMMTILNDILRSSQLPIYGGESKRWWSYLPEWMFTRPYRVSENFSQFVQVFIDEILFGLNRTDLTLTEINAIENWKK